MKKIFFSIVMLFFVQAAKSQIETPRPSPEGSVYAKVGLTDVTINYFRPKVKGRKIFGEGGDYLIPYGQLWRAGANSGSKLIISTDITIGGKSLKAGEYLIFVTPDADEWTFHLYSDLTLGGNVAAYKKENEVVAVSAAPMKLQHTVESLTFNISDVSEDNTSANIELAWADVSFKIPVKVEFDAEVMATIEANTKVNPQNYVAAANYYLTTGREPEQALKWMNMYLAIGENSTQFWHVHTKAKILAAMGNKKEAKATALASMEMAKNFPQGDFGYIKRNQELIDGL